MTTRWKQKASLAFTIISVIFLLLVIIFIWSAHSNGMLSSRSSTSSSTTSDIYPFNISTEKNHQLPNYVGNNNVNETTEIENVSVNWKHRQHHHQQPKNEDAVNKTIIVDTTSSHPEEYLREELVKPSKIHLPLHTDDLLYESKKNNSYEYIHGHRITGNYRNRSSRIWDPHPEYQIEAFGHHLHLILYQDATFMPNTLKVTHVWSNRTENEKLKNHEELKGCFYKGHVRGDDKSSVTVSLCDGMRGHIYTKFGSFFIEPVEEYRNQDSNILHKIRRESKPLKDDLLNMAKNKKNCPINEHMKDYNWIDDDDIKPSPFESNEQHERRKRSTYNDHEFTLEVLIAVDRKMQEFHGEENIKSYILTLMSIVSKIYSDASIGNSINIAVVNIMLIKEDLRLQYMEKGVYASHLLKLFCSFMQKRHDHYDTAILLTREQICRNTTETKCDTLGLAELGTVCSRQSCSIVQDNGLPAAFTIAHELGHILYMPHDDDSKCDKFRKGGKPMLNIMSSTMGDEIHPWSWSDCSRHYVTEFLEKTAVECMNDQPDYRMERTEKTLPGEIYSLDQQCELIHGDDAKYCNIYLQDEKECGRLWCFEQTDRYDCRSSNLPWADGTPCKDHYHWCQKGSCVRRDRRALTPIHGKWGQWSEYTECSRTCGGGIQESQRECNNPTPANGGKYCAGKPKEYRACNTQDCLSEVLDFREQQCIAKNGNHFDIPGIDENVKWVPKYGVSPKDECKLYCRVEKSGVYFQLAEKVIDGTTCSFDSFNKCVNGVCRPAGCDNKLYSDTKLDSCGVCQGRNDTCDVITKNIYSSDIEGQKYSKSPFYFYITRIPAGAANIIITQPGYPLTNYIVLLDDRGEYLINGNKVINTFKKSFPYAGVTFDYNGSNTTIEKVNTTYSRKIKRDLIIEILSLPQESRMDNVILLTFSYTLSKNQNHISRHSQHNINNYNNNNIYDWKLEEWTPCDSICGGTSYRTPVCLDMNTGHKVSESQCNQRSKLQKQYSTCNTDCELILNLTSMSECSSKACGIKGKRTKNYNCIQKSLTNNHSNIVDISYCQTKHTMQPHEDCIGSCTMWSYTSWSQCSQSCRIGHQYGKQSRSIVCLAHPNGPIVDDTQCSHLSKQSFTELIKICNIEPCPEWAYGEKTPRVEMQSDTSRYPIRPSLIVPSLPSPSPPSSSSSSSTSSHPLVNYYPPNANKNLWAFTEWSQCNKKCQRTRRVYCNDSNPYNCPDHLRPSDKQKCCDFKYVPYWKSCSAQCGHGTRKRDFNCARVYKSGIKGVKPRKEIIDINECSHLKKPKPKRSSKRCKVLCKWTLGKWSPCSCKTKYSTADLKCINNNGTIIANEYCPKKKPMNRKNCFKCKKKANRFSNCTCDGFRTTHVMCTNADNHEENCYEYHNKEECIPPSGCLPRSCLQISKRIRRDGDYMISIKGKTVQIYCHNMTTGYPLEYITLTNGSENFSHYYRKRTAVTTKCPPESRHEEFEDSFIEYGSTTFKKVRLILNPLQIVEDDYTFAQNNGKPQPYGSAGDCYNSNGQCPQGYFSIDLNNTGFRIRPKTTWETYGDFSTIDYTQKLAYPYTSVKASCGGYCGGCKVSQHSKLYLDVV